MKKQFLPLILMTITFLSCKTDKIFDIVPSGNLTVGDVVNGGQSLTFLPTTQTVSNYGWAQFPLFAGSNLIDLVDLNSMPGIIYYNQSLAVANVGNYSLFLGGSSPTQIDTVLITENYKNYTDSLCGVRFMNLLPGSNPVSVDLAGSTNGSEAISLAYKAYSDFKQYSATVANTTYNYEFRDVATGDLIAGFSLNTPYFHNVTLALTGTAGNQFVVQINHP